MAKKKPKLIPAVGYLRKSTVDEKTSSGNQKRQSEKSISQQKKETIQLSKGKYAIVDWYSDENTPGWKRGVKRAGFQSIMERAKQRGDFQAILCDNIDRFSRANFDEVQEDALALKRAGVRWIVTAAQGTFDLGRKGHDIAEIMRFVVAVWAAHEFSRQLSRRVSIARRNAAQDGKRTCAPPYGMENDGKGGLKFGDSKLIRVVRWVFSEFVEQHTSLNAIADALNRKGTPPPRGKAWYACTVKGLLERKAYAGDFSYNERGRGQFYRVNTDGEVVETSECEGKGKVFLKKGRYKPVIDREMWTAAQKRLIALNKNRSLRKRSGYALTGILVCNHCGRPMYGATVNGHATYRCNSPSQQGPSACKQYAVREAKILPFILKTLLEEIDNLRALQTEPPEELAQPDKVRAEQQEQLKGEREKLVEQIATAEKNLLFVKDGRTRRSLDGMVSGLRDQLDQIDAQLSDAPPTAGFTDNELDALGEWWVDYYNRAVKVPIDDETMQLHGGWECTADPEDGNEVRFDPRLLNCMLHELGTEVRLHWDTVQVPTKAGNKRTRHLLSGGRFRLGQRKGKLPRHVSDSLAGQTQG